MKNTSEMKLPFLLETDTDKFDRLMHKGNLLRLQIKEVKEAYDLLKLGAFDNKVFQSLLTGGVNPIENRLIADVEAQYDKLNFRSATIHNEMLSGAYDLIDNLRKAVERLTLKANKESETEFLFPVQLITIDENGKAQISEDSQEQIKETYCRLYLKTEADKNLYLKLQAAADACNDVMAELKANNVDPSVIPHSYGFSNAIGLMMQALYSKDDNHLTVNHEWVLAVTKRYKKSMQAA